MLSHATHFGVARASITRWPGRPGTRRAHSDRHV